MTDQARSDRRYPSTQSLQVRCPTWADFAQLYAADVSDGGMFIKTEEPLPLMTEIAIELSLPEGHQVQLEARVVHVIEPERAAREGRAAGVGVQFTGLDGARKQQIQQLVAFSRWEGATENRTSLATRLFETSVSVAPSEVLMVLSQPSPASLTQAPRRTGSAAHSTAAPGSTRGPSASHDAAGATTSRPRARSVKAPADERPSQAVAAPASTPRPADAAKLKLAMTHLAHKQFEEAIIAFSELVKETGGNQLVQQWLLLARARASAHEGEPQAAAEHYQGVLELDEQNREARKFVREHDTKKRLESLPFGRYFVKKS